MSNPLAIAVASMLLAGPATAISIMLVPAANAAGSRARGLIGLGGSLSALTAAASVLAAVLQLDAPAVLRIEFGSWLSRSGALPFHDPIGLRVDAMSMSILCAMAFAVCLSYCLDALSFEVVATPGSALLWVFAATSMLLLSSSDLQFLFFWQLSSVIAFVAAAVDKADPLAASAARKGLLLGRLGDISLVVGLLMIARLLKQPEAAECAGWIDLLANGNRLFEHSPPNRLMLQSAAFFLVGGVVTRAGQIPFFGWVDDASSSFTPKNLILLTSLVMPAGVVLAARCTNVISPSDPLQLAALFIGGFTAFFAAMSAICATGILRVLGYATTSLAGWMLLGLGNGTHAAAVQLLVVQIVTAAVVCLIATRRDSSADAVPAAAFPNSNGTQSTARERFVPGRYRWTMLAAAVLLGSGFWGQGAILARLANDVAGHFSAGHSPGMSPSANATISLLLLALGTLALFLLAAALFREFFLASKSAVEVAARSTAGISTWLTIATVTVGVAALVPESLANGLSVERATTSGVPESASRTTFDLFAISLACFPAIAGIVTAWLRSEIDAGGTPQPRYLAPIVRLSRNRYYFDDFFFFIAILPVRAMGQLSRFFDWFFIDGLMVQLPSRVSSSVVKLARPQEHSSVHLLTLAIVLAAAVLIAAILWLRG